MIAWFRKLINPPYSLIDMFTIIGLLLILFTIPAISLNVISVREPLSKAAQAPPCKSYGDTDLDGDVDIADAVHILNHVAGKQTAKTPFNAQQLKNADVDGDGRVTAADNLKITRFIAGMDVTFNTCADPDGDHFSNATEKYLGTDPYDSCSNSTSHDALPPDFNRDRVINVLDVTSFVAPTRRLDTKVGDRNFSRRWDLNGDGKISHNNNDLVNSDIEAMRSYLNTLCSNATSKPTLGFTGNNSFSPTVNRGEQITLRWSTTNAGSPCEASGGWGGLKNNSGETSFSVDSSTMYTLLCGGSNGKTEKSVPVNVRPCSGTLIYTMNNQTDGTVIVNSGASVTSKGSGLTSCSSSDKLYLQYWNWDSGSSNKWTSLGLPCALNSSGTCSISWIPSDKLAKSRNWPTRMTLNQSSDGDGTVNSSKWVDIAIQEQAPPPPTASCSGSPILYLSQTTAQSGTGTKITATSKGFSNCGSGNTQFFWIRPVTRGWLASDYFAQCNFASSPNECSVTFDQPNELGRYVVAVTYEPAGGVQVNDIEYLDVIVAPSPTPIPTPSGGSQDEIKNFIRDYVGGQNVQADVAGGGYYETVNIGQFLFGLAGCESGWYSYNVRKLDGGDPNNSAHWIWQYEIGLYQYQHHVNYVHPIANAPVPSSQYATWEGAASSSGTGSDPWNYQHQVKATNRKVRADGGSNVNAWSCYKGGGWRNFISSW